MATQNVTYSRNVLPDLPSSTQPDHTGNSGFGGLTSAQINEMTDDEFQTGLNNSSLEVLISVGENVDIDSARSTQAKEKFARSINNMTDDDFKTFLETASTGVLSKIKENEDIDSTKKTAADERITLRSGANGFDGLTATEINNMTSNQFLEGLANSSAAVLTAVSNNSDVNKEKRDHAKASIPYAGNGPKDIDARNQGSGGTNEIR
ncbi:hypothetical protein RCH09_000909 [Actimicrobium sp. GrIS 1.19]|uniref:hypothetical protein n=1 Tax=Actimicrobium sp. GrIS 1.19 TaxID=3071708 RepID=UPI002E0B49DD|nr:hypothetical protein [Actimicrobium sp. GrIS 1.19]